MDTFLNLFSKEKSYLGGESLANMIALLSICMVIVFYFAYYFVVVTVRKKTVIRNPLVERRAFDHGIITSDQLMTKYSANLGASSTMAALSVTMVLLSVAALFETKLDPYNHFVAVMVCTLMTIASATLLYAHELYDAIINPIFEIDKRFKLRQLGSNFQAFGLVMFIVSMLLAVSTVSTLSTIVSGISVCIVMVSYMEKRIVPKDGVEQEIDRMLGRRPGGVMEEITYHRSEIRDFLEVAKLDREAWKLNRNSEYIPDGEHAWRLWVEHALVYVAKSGPNLEGAILAFPCISGIWCVHKVMVWPHRRGKGIGTKLFDILLSETDRINANCFLTVDPANSAALKLYEKWGFSDKHIVPGYYRGNEDRYVLTRQAKKTLPNQPMQPTSRTAG